VQIEGDRLSEILETALDLVKQSSGNAQGVIAKLQDRIAFIHNSNPNNHSGLNFSFGVNKTLPHWPSQKKGNDTVLLLGNHE
jgi:hypothetical protein